MDTAQPKCAVSFFVVIISFGVSRILYWLRKLFIDFSAGFYKVLRFVWYIAISFS